MRWSRGWFAASDGAGVYPMSRNGLTLLGLLAATVVLAADQASKWWVLHVIHLPDIGQISLALAGKPLPDGPDG